MKKTVVVLQPSYLPWLGYFDQIRRSDVFVFYDDVQYDKHGWRNRNRIKSPQGPYWLTVPVVTSGQNKPEVRDVKIDLTKKWQRKHLGDLKQFYGKSPFLQEYLPTLESLINAPVERLEDLNLAIIHQFCRWLKLETHFVKSSELGIDGAQTDRLVRICEHFGATHYLSGDAARTYLDVESFEKSGITVEWQEYKHPTYPQVLGEFVPYLSVVDLLLNVGEQSYRVL